MYAVSKQPLVVPVTGTDVLPIEAVTVPPQSNCPCAVTTSNPQLTGEFRVIVGYALKDGSPLIEVAILPDAVGDADGVGDAVGVAVGVGDALALGDGVTLVTADDVVVAVVDEVLVLACGLAGEVDDVQPATKIVAITVATTSKDRRLFLMLFTQIGLHAPVYKNDDNPR